jgi:phosphohistidine phosphatase
VKRLILLRHFKSSWHEPGLADHDRPLAERGQRDAALMAEAMVARGLTPDLILCSPARRTRETLAALEPGLGNGREVVFVEALYSGPEVDYRRIIAAQGGGAGRLLVIGHNPRIHATALALVGDGDKGARAHLAHKYPTGALAVIEFDADTWPDIADASGQLVAFIRPHDLAPEV